MKSTFGGDWKKRLQTARETASQRRTALLARPAVKSAGSDGVRGTVDYGVPPWPTSQQLVAAMVELKLLSVEANGEPAATVNRPTQCLVQEFLSALTQQQTKAVLQWPNESRDAAFVHVLAMMACLGGSANAGLHLRDFRTLYYPWTPGPSGSELRRHLVRREALLAWNGTHLTRVHASGEDSPLSRLVHTIGHLTSLNQRDPKPHLAHPALAEAFPVFVFDESNNSQRFELSSGALFSRSERRAGMNRQMDHRANLVGVDSAPFALFGVTARANVKRALAASCLQPHSGRCPDVCILDVGTAARRDLGHRWDNDFERFVKEAQDRFSAMPFYVVCGDPFSHSKMLSILERRKPASLVTFRRSADFLTKDPALEPVSPITAEVHAVSGDGEQALSELSAVAKATADRSLARMIHLRMGGLRRAMSLPCGTDFAYQVLCEQLNQSAAEAYLEYRSAANVIAPLREAMELEVDKTRRGTLEKAIRAVERAYSSFSQDTPVGSLLEEIVKSLARKALRTVLVFASDEELLLGRQRIVSLPEDGPRIKRHIDRNQLLLCTLDSLSNSLRRLAASGDRNLWKRIVVIAPSERSLCSILAEPWLPFELTVISDLRFARHVARAFNQVAKHADLAGPNRIGARLSRVAVVADEESRHRMATSVDLDLIPTTRHDDASVIDLIDDDEDDGTGEITRIGLRSGRTLLVGARSYFVVFDPDATVGAFQRWSMREMHVGLTIVVPDPAFVAEAKQLLPIRVLAQAQVRAYHAVVDAAMHGIEGHSRAERARIILKAMKRSGAREVARSTVEHWLNVESHASRAADEMRPNAPQRLREFSAFMDALSVPATKSLKMWAEGIQPLRIDRRKAGARQAGAFSSVLIDPHGTSAGLPSALRPNVALLRDRALDHLDVIARIETAPRNS